MIEMGKRFCRALEVPSRLLLRAGAACFLLMVSAALFVYAFYGVFLPDADTAMYWAGQCAEGAVNCLTASAVPVFLYEILKRCV